MRVCVFFWAMPSFLVNEEYQEPKDPDSTHPMAPRRMGDQGDMSGMRRGLQTLARGYMSPAAGRVGRAVRHGPSRGQGGSQGAGGLRGGHLGIRICRHEAGTSGIWRCCQDAEGLVPYVGWGN